MAKPFKFRYVNEITGGFVLLILAAVVGTVLLAGQAQRWFVPVLRLTLTFPPDTTYGLREGSKVQILETPVGTVKQIVVDEAGQITALTYLRGDFIRFVRSDSKAIARRQFGVAGDAYVEITKGSGRPLPHERAVLSCTKDTALMDTLQEVVQQVREATLPAIEQVRKAVEEYTKLATELSRPEGQLQQLLKHLNEITTSLEKGEGTAGRLLHDPALADELMDITKKINTTVAEVNQILADVQKVTAQLPPMAATISGELKDVPGAVLQAREALRETEKLVEGVQKHWLVRGYIEQGSPSERLPPSAVPAGGTP